MRQPATRRFEVLLPLRSTGRRSDIRCEPSRFGHAANPAGTRRAGSGTCCVAHPGGSPCPDPCRLVRSPRSGSSRYDACPGTSDSTRRKPASARFRFPEHASLLRAGDVESPGGQAQYIPELGAYLIVTKRFSAALANMHQHFFVSAYDAAGYPEMQAYMKACSDWALNNYQGALRGLQKGVVSYAILLQHPLNANAVAFTKELPKKHFAAFDLPILVDPFTGACEMLEKTPVGLRHVEGDQKAAREALGF